MPPGPIHACTSYNIHISYVLNYFALWLDSKLSVSLVVTDTETTTTTTIISTSTAEPSPTGSYVCVDI